MLPLVIFIVSLQEQQNVIDKIKEKYESIKTMQGEFIQRVCEKGTGTCQEMRGKFYMVPPDKFRIEINFPAEQIIVGNKDTVWVYNVVERKAIKGEGIFTITPFTMISFLKEYKKIFEYKIEKKKKKYDIILIPKNETFVFQKMKLIVTPDYIITKIKSWDSIGNEYEFIFNKIELNRKINNKKFAFTPPKEVQIIDMFNQ